MTRRSRYPQEVRERAVRLVFEHRDDHPSQWATITSIAGKFGVSPEAASTGAEAMTAACNHRGSGRLFASGVDPGCDTGRVRLRIRGFGWIGKPSPARPA